MSWELSLGFYTGILLGVYTKRYDDGIAHYLYLPFCFICLDFYLAFIKVVVNLTPTEKDNAVFGRLDTIINLFIYDKIK